MTKRLDLTGQRFTRLTAMRVSETRGSLGELKWECLCDCGETVNVTTAHLRSGHTKSCGCYHISKVTKHGKARTSTYSSWVAMTQRCLNPHNKEYKNYGGAGVSVCQRWLESFENFLKDMGEKPSGLSLDRIDPYGNYEPSNCRWGNPSDQSFNQRRSSSNTSGRTGVTYDHEVRKWHARISKENKQYNLGYYNTFEEAVAAREKAEIELYGYNKQ